MSQAIQLCLAALLWLGLGCGPVPGAEESNPDPAPAGQELPPGHPQVAPQSPSPAVPLPPQGSGSGRTALTWEDPPGWTKEPPRSAMRRAQYRVPGASGDGECVVFYFGPGQGGDATANVERWIGQFSQPDGRPSADLATTRQLDVGGLAVLVVEVAGTYSGGMAMGRAAAREHEDYMLLGAIAQGPDANWFFKFTGPRATVEGQRQAFDDLLGSLSPGQ